METNKKLNRILFRWRYAQCNSGALSVLVCIDSADFWNPIYVVSDKD